MNRFHRLLPRYDVNMEGRKMQASYDDQDPAKHVDEEGINSFSPIDPLQLDIPDDELCDIVDDWVKDYNTFYEDKYDLFKRRKKNEVYLWGRQNLDREKEHGYKDWEDKFQDNVLYEIEGTIKPLAMARLPDFIVEPENDESDDETLFAEQYSKAINSQVKDRENRFVLGLAFKHHPVYFTGVIKTWWDPATDDRKFGAIHPDLIEVDHTCSTKNADEMQFVSHIIPDESIHELFLKFPQKKEELITQLESDGLMPGRMETYSALATKVRYREVWFHYLKRQSDTKVELVHGVLWKYKKVILHKMKNPNFDYEGEDRYFVYDQGKQGQEKRGLNGQELQAILMTGQVPSHVKQEKVYKNYFKFPRKPFYFMGYDQWGIQPYDETSRIEQNIRNQVTVDDGGKQIAETIKNRGHHIWAKAALTPSDVEELDMNAPNEDVSVEGSPREVHEFVAPERPTRDQYEYQDKTRDRMYAVAHSNAVRGEIQHNTPATNTQIGRESDFTSADDLVEDTINDAALWMAEWDAQWGILRYTPKHFKWLLGNAGLAVYQRLHQNGWDEGMLIKIKASGTDKLKAQNNAMDMAKMQMVDPHSFYVMMGLPDPDGLTEKLILAKADPIAYLQKVSKGLDTSEALAQALMKAQMPLPQQSALIPSVAGQGAPAPAQPAPQQPMPQPAPQAPAPAMPQNPSAGNTSGVPISPPTQPPVASPRIM